MRTMPRLSAAYCRRRGDRVAEGGTWLLACSQTMPSAAVVVRAPAQAPNRIAGSKRKIHLPMNIDRINGTDVAKMPHMNRLTPWVRRPLTNPGPAEMPTMAMKTLSPTEFMNHTVEDGIRPKNGRVERSQPKTRPEMRAPPAVDRVSGTPPTFHTSAPMSAPSVMAPPMKATSATSLGRSGTPRSLVAAEVSEVRPTSVRMSPRWICVLGRMGIDVATAPRVIVRRKTPRALGSCASSARVLPSTALFVT